MKVYIHQVNGQFSDDWLFAAYLGFKKKGCDIYYFEDINDVPFAFDNVVVTGVDESIDYFIKNNIPVPSPFNIPEELNKEEFLNRQIKIMSMGEFMEDKTTPIFVKPHSRYKEFSSGTIENLNNKKYFFDGIPNESLVMASTVVDFLSEYRCFVYNGKLIDVKHYQGDFTLFPDIKAIESMITEFESAPVAYTLDVGIIREDWSKHFPDWKTILVEVQDMWSIGHYGLDIQSYSSMLRDRWFQIIRQK